MNKKFLATSLLLQSAIPIFSRTTLDSYFEEVDIVAMGVTMIIILFVAGLYGLREEIGLFSRNNIQKMKEYFNIYYRK